MAETGEKIRFLRKQRGWRQRDLASATGLSTSTIGHIETGERKGEEDSLQLIADELGVSYGLLIDPKIELSWLEKASHILHKIQGLDEDQLAVVEQMISALQSSRQFSR